MDLSRAKMTSDGRPAGTPHFNKFETGLTVNRYSFPLFYDDNFYGGKIVFNPGCGYGSGTKYLIEEGAIKIFAVDFNEEAIKIAKEKFSDDNIEYFSEDLLSFDTPECDVIVACEIVEHVTDKELDKLLSEWYNKLSVDGYLYVSTPERRLPKDRFPNGSHWTEYDFEELVDIIESHGFELVWSRRKNELDNISMALIFKR